MIKISCPILTSNNKTYNDYLFGHFIYYHDGIYNYENIVYGSDSKYFYTKVLNELKYIAENFFDYYHEYFCFAEFQELEDCCSIEEIEAVKELINNRNDCDIIWEVIQHRFLKHKELVTEGQESLNELKLLKSFIDDFLDRGMMEITDRSYYQVVIDGVKEFAPYFLKFVHCDVGSCKRLDPMIPFQKQFDKFAKLVERDDWPQNDVQFGRFLEWVDLYRCLVED